MATATSSSTLLFLNPNFSSSTSLFINTSLFLKPSSHLLQTPKPSTALATKCSLQTLIPTRPEYIPNRISDPAYVRIFDTTLRDGEQSPGATMTSKEKLDIARQLSRLGIDIIEAGFPAASRDDLEAVRTIAREVGNTVADDGHVPVICGLSRCNKSDIDAAWEAVKYAKRPRIHTFIATSDIHLEFKLRKTREEVVAIAREMVAYARSLGCEDVEFSPEDAGRSDKEFLYLLLEEVIKSGATTLNIPDTVGYTLPDEFGQLIADIKANTRGIENVIISTHCQNDLGLSTANTLAGAKAGARQLEVTINGIGERAGNASLEEVVMAIKCRGKELMGGLYTGINTRYIVMASRMVAEYSGLHVQPHKAIVGSNAFAHESGIHQDGMLKHKGTYEIISPEDIGLSRSSESGIVLGKHSGRHALRSRLLELGYELDGRELDDLFWRFKAVAEKKKHISDGASLQIILGYSQLWGIFSRFFSPLGMAPVIGLVGLGLFERGFPVVGNCVEIGIPMLLMVIGLSQFLKHIRPFKDVPIFERFPVLICVAIIWAYSHVLTAGGAYRHSPRATQISCRTDRANLISSAPWFKFPYPLQWGAPTFDAGHTFAMMAAVLVSLIESTGAYKAASRLAIATPPPSYVLSRGIGWQGIGILLDGLFGTGTGSTVSVENVGLLGLTRVGSRRVVEISAGFMIFFSILGKFGALFASIPFPIFAALHCVLFALVASVGLSFLQFTNMNSMRNLVITGLSLYLGISVPQFFNEFRASSHHGPVHTHAGWFNGFLNTIFSSPPTVGLIVAVFLDNTLEVEKSKKDRGMPWWVKFRTFRGDNRNEEFYTLPFNLNRFFPPT